MASEPFVAKHSCPYHVVTDLEYRVTTPIRSMGVEEAP